LPRAITAAEASIGTVSYLKQSLTRYARQREEGMGCGSSCLIHLVMLVLLFVAVIIWCIRNRAWEMVITIIFPE
jgi:hypothetical protein